MTDADAMVARLRDRLREAEAAKIDPKESAAHFLWSSLTLRVAPPLLAALPWPLETLFPDHPVTGEVLLQAVLRIPGPEAIREQRREQHRGRVVRWTLRTLLDGVRPQTAHDLTWRALCEAEALLLSMDDTGASVASIEALARHPSLHVRGYAWLGWLSLHERGERPGHDLSELAGAEPPELRVIAIWVITTIDPTRDVRALFDGLLDEGVAEHVREGALKLLTGLPPAPLRDLAPRVAAISRARGTACAAWCRLDPEVWPELVAISEEHEPLERTLRIERRYARAGLPVPSHVRTERAHAALHALEHGVPFLSDDAVEAIVARAADEGFDRLLMKLGHRARGAVDVIEARPLGTSRYARRSRVALLAALGGPQATAAIETHVCLEPELVRDVSSLGEDAVPLLRGALARAVDAKQREMALWAAAALGSASLAADLWPLLEDRDEVVVCSAIQALLAADVVNEPLERARVLEAFLRFQPTDLAFGPHFFRLAETLAARAVPWLTDALDRGDETLAMRVVRTTGHLRSWAVETLPELERVAAHGGPALRAELARAKERIMDPPPMFRPNR